MSKPALGRGLASLLNSPERNSLSLPANGSASSPDPAGVQLLLRGFVAEHMAKQRECEHELERVIAGRSAVLRLAIPLLWVADALMVTVATWAVLTVHQPVRFLIATALIVVGGLLGCLAAWLNWPPILQIPPEIATEADVPRIRIRLMDDRPDIRTDRRSDSRHSI